METNYYIHDVKTKEGKPKSPEHVTSLHSLIALLDASTGITKRSVGRNSWTRAVDRVLTVVRTYAPPLHWIFASLTALLLYLYIRLVSLTIRLVEAGELAWPNLPASCVVALWHRDAPSLLVAFAKLRPTGRCIFLIADDPRGDCLSTLCRMLGFAVLRKVDHAGALKVLEDLTPEIEKGAAVFITVDGGGPPRIAKFGAIIVAAATNVPLIPLRADCSPALAEIHKWDQARNPLPFSRVVVALSRPGILGPSLTHASIIKTREWLQGELNSKIFDRDWNR